MELTNKVINSCLCLFASAAIGAGGMYLYNKDKIKSGGEMAIIKECKEILDKKGYENTAIKEKDLLDGYLNSFGDPYTFYTKADECEGYLASVNGTSCLVTCGYKVWHEQNNRLVVMSVTAGSYAEEQGLMVGDVIISIDGKSIEENGIVPTALDLSGKDGTMMKLVIERDGRRLDLDFKRYNDFDNAVENVKFAELEKTLYISISAFDMTTAMEFRGKLEDYGKTPESVVLDLRDNLGGTTTTSVEIADMFVGDGFVTMFYNDGSTKKYTTEASESDITVPVVVLCNDQTASAAEIMTALLKQYGKDVTLVGTKTFGKGIFQNEEKLSDGGVLRYTAGYYTVGEWECYHGVGIEPDIEVEMDRSLITTDDDIQLKKALSLVG